MDVLKTFERFKLLAPERGGTFKDDIIAARQAHANSSKNHILHERLVISYLAYRARYEVSASVREISSATRLHHKSVTKALKSLGAAVVKTRNKWSAKEPPTGWFAERKTGSKPNHWYDKLAYTMFYVPSQGAVVKYKETTRRFGVNHAAVFATIVNQARQANGVIRKLTISGTAVMLGLCRPTVKSVIDDLIYAGFIEAVDLGSSFDITLLPITPQLCDGFFAKKPEPKTTFAPKKVVPVEKTARSLAYEMKGDTYDDYRNACKQLMPQSYCEEAIEIAKDLGDCVLGFQDQIRMAKEQHQKNKLMGGIGVGNFGKYFVVRMKNRFKEKQRQERELVAQANREEFLNSDEHKAAMKKRDSDAAADPLHDFHCVTEASILERVQLGDSPVKSLRAAKRIMDQVHHRCKEHLSGKGGWVEPASVFSLCQRVLSHALSALNVHYQSESLATPNQLKEQIDTVLANNNLEPVFGDFEEVAHV